MILHKQTRWLAAMLPLLLLAGCATTNSPNFHEAKSPAWSLYARQEEMVVSVSPAGKTLRLLGSSGMVVGALYDAGVNDKYARKVSELLDGYDTRALMEERFGAALEQAVGEPLKKVEPLGSTAGFSSRRDAEKARFEGLARTGCDSLLDLRVLCGLFGPEGALIMKTSGRLYELPGGEKRWVRDLVIPSSPAMAYTTLGDPTEQLKPEFHFKLSVDDEALGVWFEDDGSILKKRIEECVDISTAAVLCDLGLAETAAGYYGLGRAATQSKSFEAAEAYFVKAVALEPGNLDVHCARAVNLAHNKQVDDAISYTENLVKQHPDYGPAWMNLSWWQVMDKKNLEQARSCYDKAVACGMTRLPGLEKLMEK